MTAAKATNVAASHDVAGEWCRRHRRSAATAAARNAAFVTQVSMVLAVMPRPPRIGLP